MDYSIPATLIASPPANPRELAFFFLMVGQFPGLGHLIELSTAWRWVESRKQMNGPLQKTPLNLQPDVRCVQMFSNHVIVIWNFQTFNQKLVFLIPHRMNQMRPVAKSGSSCTLIAPDVAILEFKI